MFSFCSGGNINSRFKLRIYGNEIFRLKVFFSGAQIIVVVTEVQDRLMTSKMPHCSNYHLDLGQSCSLVRIATLRYKEKVCVQHN